MCCSSVIRKTSPNPVFELTFFLTLFSHTSVVQYHTSTRPKTAVTDLYTNDLNTAVTLGRSDILAWVGGF